MTNVAAQDRDALPASFPEHHTTRLERLRFRLGCAADRACGRAGRVLVDRPLGDWRDVPVVINSFNRLGWLRQLVEWLRGAGMRRILVLDNGSSYPPLVEWLRTTREAEVIRLGANVGSFALWRTRAWLGVAAGWYVYTDPDVLPDAGCPADVVARLHDVLLRHPAAHKAGLGLRIDDLPDHYARKQDVLRWEAQHWRSLLAPGVYDAAVDTTFALYRPLARGGWWIPGVRTGEPLVARHLPWYSDTAHPDEEEQHYRRVVSARFSYWTVTPG